MSGGRQRTLGVGIQHILDYLKRMQAENPAFYYAVQGDGDHSGWSILGIGMWIGLTKMLLQRFFQEPAIVFAGGLYSENHRGINEAATFEEFESCWEALLNKYYIMDNEWLQLMYSARQQWGYLFM
ncbi:Protein FAR1-RELATED SEQUENCE 5, partial [Cucurbita argyrosperma subsp. argyrosperma]